MAEPVIIDGVYHLKEQIGKGGMAAVYLAEVDLDKFDFTLPYAYTQVKAQAHTQRRLEAQELAKVLKTMDVSRATMRAICESEDIPLPGPVVAVKVALGEAEADRFESEWKNLLCLHHENVVEVYGGGVHDRRPYYAMELLENLVSPERVMDQFSIRQKLGIILQAGRGLQYLHDHELIHRDIKPSNLLTCEDAPGQYRTKVTDLGLGKAIGEELGLTLTNQMVGSPYYMSPEQFASSRTVDHRADIYSLGAALYELATGFRPYHDKTSVFEIVGAVAVGERPVPPAALLPGLPAAVVGMIECAMAAERADRYQTMSELIADLERYLAEESQDLTASTVFVPAAATQSRISLGTGKYKFEGHKPARPAGKAPAAPLRGGLRAKPAMDARAAKPLAGVRATASAFGESKPPAAASSFTSSRTGLLVGLGVAGVVIVVLAVAFWPKPPAPKPGPALPAVALKPVEVVKPTPPQVPPARPPPAAKVPRTAAEELHAALRARNPAYTGNGAFRIEHEQIVEVSLRKCGVADLVPLKNLPLRQLDCSDNQITDLSPLKGVPLTWLDFSLNQVRDLTPLAGMKLTTLKCAFNRAITDLAPLKDMPLAELECNNNRITDLSPLHGLPLTTLAVGRNGITELTGLKGLRLTALSCYGNQIGELSPLAGMPLARLDCFANQIADLSPLQGMPLATLNCHANRVVDLTPLKGLPLTTFSCGSNRITDLSPLAGLHLKAIFFTPKDIIHNVASIRRMDSITEIGPDPNQRMAPAEFWRRYDAGEFGLPDAAGPRVDPAAQKPAAAGNAVTINVAHARLLDVCAILSRAAGVPITCGGAFNDKPVTLSVKNAPLADVVQDIAKQAGCHAEARDGGYRFRMGGK